MQFIRLNLICFASFLLSACSRNYKVDIPVSPAELAGLWEISAAPALVTNSFRTNPAAPGNLELRTDGGALFSLLPIHELPGTFPIATNPWSFVSGPGKWGLSDWGKPAHHIWRVDLETRSRGIQLTVGKQRHGELVLVYTPDPDHVSDAVVFRRAKPTRARPQ
jgi:hypothetical protein